MKKTKKSLRRITATLVAMAASVSFADAPISGAGITFSMPSFSASAADTDVLTYKDFSYKVTENGIVITAYNGSEANPVIPSAIDETAVTAIGSSAFAENTSITAVTIPSSITTIENKAFKDCTKLEKLTLNEGLTTIGEACFANTKISSVAIPSTLTDVHMSTSYYTGPFSGCNLLKDITFSEKSTIISEYLFKNCSGLETITIPDTITTINKSAFAYCSNLSEVELSSATSIGDSVFNSCTNLTEIEIPSSVTTIGKDAFKDCTKLEKLTLNEGVTTIGEACFANTKISSINIPSTLIDVHMSTSYYTGPFSGCNLLKDVIIDDKATKIPNYLFKNCSTLVTIDIPYFVRNIGKSAFENCTSLKNITIHNPYCEIYDKNNTIPSSAAIKGYASSTAKHYARSYEREFVSLGSYTRGDVNEDGSINSSDASKVLEEYALIQTGAEPTFTEIQMISADVNKDYTIDSSDASKILAYYADSSTGKTPSWD